MSRLRLLPARRGLLELACLAALYVAYSASRLVADDSLTPARDRAHEIVAVEADLGLRWEYALNRLFVDVDWLGLLGSYWYATAHYVVTIVVLLWLYRRGPEHYLPARRALVVATALGLVLYLLMPTAPPRFVGGYVDVLHLHAASGWWGGDASAPKGLGGLTNELAAFPSLHAGWSLWVAIVVTRSSRRHGVQALGWAHAAITALVVVGTGNHWVLDVVFGWVVVALGVMAVDRVAERSGHPVPGAARRPATPPLGGRADSGL